MVARYATGTRNSGRSRSSWARVCSPSNGTTRRMSPRLRAWASSRPLIKRPICGIDPQAGGEQTFLQEAADAMDETPRPSSAANASQDAQPRVSYAIPSLVLRFPGRGGRGSTGVAPRSVCAHSSFLLKRLASTFPGGYIPCMEWQVEYTDALGAWWDYLIAEEQKNVNVVVILLQRFGPALRFPYSSSLASSRHSHMRELRVQHAGRSYRILYAFETTAQRSSG
jgi:Phage derived protein Gp49-like (DUF891)